MNADASTQGEKGHWMFFWVWTWCEWCYGLCSHHFWIQLNMFAPVLSTAIIKTPIEGYIFWKNGSYSSSGVVLYAKVAVVSECWHSQVERIKHMVLWKNTSLCFTRYTCQWETRRVVDRCWSCSLSLKLPATCRVWTIRVVAGKLVFSTSHCR